MADQNQLAGILDVFGIYEGGRKRALEEQRQKIVNQLYGQALNTRTGQIDYPSVYQGLAREGMASAIPEMQKEEYERRQAYAQTMGTEAENIIKKMDMFKKSIPATPGEAQVWVDRAFSDPDVGPLLSLFGTREEAIAAVPRDMGEFDRWRVNSALFADEVIKTEKADLEGGIGYIRPATGEQVGETVMKVPYDPELAEQRRRQAAAGVPKPPKEEEEYSKIVGKTAGEKDFAFYDAANAAVDGLTRTNETLNLLDTGQPITGAAAELQLNVERLITAVTGRKDKKIEDTEVLDALLGSDVFAQIQALGIGARGLDTPAEREYMRKVISGTITLDRNSLRRMAEIRANVQGRVIDRYNQRVQRGELDRFFQKSGIPKRTLEKPTRQQSAASPAVTGGAGVTLNIPGRGPVTFPNRQAADAAKEALRARGINVEG